MMGRASSERGRRPPWLLVPGTVVFCALLLAPLAYLADQSFRTYIPGQVGAATGAAHTLDNYLELAAPAYLLYFYDTFRISLMATLAGVGAGYLIAFRIARTKSRAARRAWIAFIVGVLFLSQLVRVYAIGLAFAPGGLFRAAVILLGMSPNGAMTTEVTVILGMLSYLIPIAALTLIGTIQNIDPALTEAGQSLGAAPWQTHLGVTIPLSIPGLLSAFLIDFTLCISAFVVPLVLGRGQVMFVSNLIYTRFGELADYPSGAAVSIIMLVLSLLLVYAMSFAASRRSRG